MRAVGANWAHERRTARQDAAPDGAAIVALVLRALFIVALVVAIVRLSSPQSETIWSVYESPGDLIRLALGFVGCLWLVVHIFMLPKDAEGYWTWLYIGPVVVPLAWVIAIAVW